MNKKIVLIEDNLEMRENIQEILELADYTVFAAENGKVGVKLVKEQLPNLVLCDIMMPELDGYGVLHLISRNPETASIPFIFLTAKAEKEDFRKGMNLGADDYLTKPFDDIELLDAVEQRLNRVKQFSSENESTEGKLEHFFENLNEVGLEELTTSERVKNFKKKDDIYMEGDYANFMYYVKNGKVKCYKMNPDGKELITNLYSKGDFFGYMPLITGEHHEDSATALDDTELVLVNQDHFLNLLYSSKEISGAFIKMLSGSVQAKQEELLNLAYDSVRKRVADSLVKLSEKFNQEDSSQFSMAISRDDLAAMVGTATESVIRTLSEFKQDGYIEIKGSKITITNLEELKNFRF